MQAALLFLLERDVTLFFGSLAKPSVDELKWIRQALFAEVFAKTFKRSHRIFSANAIRANLNMTLTV